MNVIFGIYFEHSFPIPIIFLLKYLLVDTEIEYEGNVIIQVSDLRKFPHLLDYELFLLNFLLFLFDF